MVPTNNDKTYEVRCAGPNGNYEDLVPWGVTPPQVRDRVLTLVAGLQDLLSSHRGWIGTVSEHQLSRIMEKSRIVVVWDRERKKLVGCAVLHEFRFFSLQQVLVRDYCVAPDCAVPVRALLEEQVAVFARYWKLTQAFCTNSNESEQSELMAAGWDKVPTTVLIKRFEE